MASAGPLGGLVLSASQVRVFQSAPIYRAR
jgi:hypothetical protein